MYHTYFYLVCTQCSVKQYIGTDLEEIRPTLDKLIGGIQATAMQGAVGESISTVLHSMGNSLLIALKFIKRHHGHNLCLWDAADDTSLPFTVQSEDDTQNSYAAYPEEWLYFPEHCDFDAPDWHSHQLFPLPSTREVERLQAESDRWKHAYQEQYQLRNKLERSIYHNNPDKQRVLAEEMKALVATVVANKGPLEKDYATSCEEAITLAIAQNQNIDPCAQLMGTRISTSLVTVEDENIAVKE